MKKKLSPEVRAAALVAQMTLEEKISQMQYAAPAIERLGVPAYNWWNEALHGYARSGRATVFPQAIGMAASFDPDLLYSVAEAISTEARAKFNEYRKSGGTGIYQGITLWSPNINIFRDPRWGRGHETYGEDPTLTGVMGTAFVRGIQGEGEVRRADATLKHYAVHSGPESLRHGFDAVVSEKDLDETYLPAFRTCIEHAHPSAVMGAYNRVNGEPCCASETLLQKKLYGEFGFDGYVVSDCGAIADISEHHHAAANLAEAAALAVKNGCTLNCGSTYKWLETALVMGLIDEETITEATERLFTARYRLGMFDDDCPFNDIPYSAVECEKHRALNLEMARESIVLLKNDGLLPLKPGTKVAVIGPNADSRDVLLGNYNGMPSVYYTLLRGIQEKAPDALWAPGCHLYKEKISRHSGIQLDEALVTARQADVVILCMGLAPVLEGEEGGEGGIPTASDANGDRLTLELPAPQRELYHRITELGKPVVFVNVSGSCVNLSEQKTDCNAILQCFYPGAMGGKALADILYGEVSPSGRLPVTFYRSVDDLPPFEDYSMENRTYRFFRGEPVYSFGFGLDYSGVREEWADESTVTLVNPGAYDVNYSVLRYTSGALTAFKKVLVRAYGDVTVRF